MKLRFVIPDTFKIAGMEFVVQHPETINNGDDYGEYDDVDNAVRLAKQIGDKNDLRDIKYQTRLNTFFHELIHTFQYYYNCKYDEAQAQTFANFLVEFFQTAEYHEET